MHYVLRNMPSFLHVCVLSDATFENLLTENDEMPFRSGGGIEKLIPKIKKAKHKPEVLNNFQWP